MTEPYLFEKAIGQQMGDLCRLAVGDAKVTQTGEIVTLEDMPGRGNMGVSVDVPYTSGGVQRLVLSRCGKNLMPNMINRQLSTGSSLTSYYPDAFYVNSMARNNIYKPQIPCNIGDNFLEFTIETAWYGVGVSVNVPANATITVSSPSFSGGTLSATYLDRYAQYLLADVFEATNQSRVITTNANAALALIMYLARVSAGNETRVDNIQVELGSTATAYEPYNGDTYTITLPAGFYGGTVDLKAGTVTSRYAADGTELAEPVVTEIDPISIPILAGVNNVWADTGTVTVSYYAADAETFRPSLWYPTIYRGLTSARYLIKRASGAIASFDDAVAAPLVGLRVALPWRSEGYDAVSVTRASYTGDIPATIDINASQDGSGDPSPENVRPIRPGLSLERDDETTLDVYGGTLSTTNNTLNIAYTKRLLPTTGWSDGGALRNNHRFYKFMSPTMKIGTGQYGLCSVFTLVPAWDIDITGIRFGQSNPAIYVYYPVDTVADLQSALSTISDAVGGIEVMYPLATQQVLQLTNDERKRALEALGYTGDTYTITLPTTIYGGYLDVVTGQLVATHDENGNLLANQKLYFLDPVNVSALAGVNNIWSDAGDVAVSYRIDNG